VAAQVAGEIDALNADRSAAVTAGEVLARIDSASADGQLRDAEATCGAAEIELSRAQRAADDARQRAARAESLTSAQMIARADLDATETTLDEANAGLAAAESEVMRARAALRQASAFREQTIIRSPIDGIVASRNVVVGQTVASNPQSPALFTIAADLKQLRLLVRLEASDVEAVHAGDPVTFEVATVPNETFHGTVAEVRPAAAGGMVIGYSLIVDVPNANGTLTPGLTATLNLQASRRDNVVRIPNRALAFHPQAELLDTFSVRAVAASDADIPAAQGQLGQVWLYDGKQFIGITVRTGLSDGTWTELLSGRVHSGDLLTTGATPEQRSRD
jgi:HlyD family secretion protein